MMRNSDFLRIAMKTRGILVEELAQKAKVGTNAVYNWLGERGFDWRVAKKIAPILGVTPLFLMFGGSPLGGDQPLSKKYPSSIKFDQEAQNEYLNKKFNIPRSKKLDFFSAKENEPRPMPAGLLPVLGAIPCGPLSEIPDNQKREWATAPARDVKANHYYLRAAGESMAPTIPNHALVMMDHFPAPLILPARPPADVRRRPADFRVLARLGNGIFAVLRNREEAALKRLNIKMEKSGWQLYLEPDNRSDPHVLVKAEDEIRVIAKAIRVVVDL